MDEMENRIIVIGSEGHYGVKTTSWDASDMPNIADFTNAILNISSLNSLFERISDKKITEARREKLADIIYNNLKYVKDRLINILHSKGNIYVICAPELRTRVRSRYIDNYEWSPFPIELLKEEGKTITLFNDSFKIYFQHIKKWLFCFAEKEHVSSEVSDFYENKYYIKPKTEVIAENRYKKPISIKLNYSVHKKVKHIPQTRAFAEVLGHELPDYNDEAEHTSGEIVFLPPPTEIDSTEAINLLLEELFQIQQKTPPPKEIEDILIPGEDKFNAQLQELREQLRAIIAAIREIETDKAALTKFKQLLYENSDPLEDICKLTLSNLGCKTDDSFEDFILTKDDKEAIVEVKGREGVIERKDGGQLSQNKRHYAITQEKEMKEVKAILLGNPWRFLFPLEERYKRDLFAPHLVKDAKNDEMALVTTQELFKAYCAFLEGKVSCDDIVNRLFSGIGITQLIE